MNQPQNTRPQLLKSGSYQMATTTSIAFVNNKDEAMMINVAKGFAVYIFETMNPIFYVKEVDATTGQVSFCEYNYTEVIPQPAPDSSNFVTKDDMNLFKNDLMNSIAAMISRQKEGEVCG